MFIAADRYLAYCRTFRVIYAGGRYGSGKTLLSVATGLHFLRKGWASQIVANFPLTGAQDYVEADFKSVSEYRDTFFIYDESWLDLGQGAGFKNIVAYLANLRKVNSYLFLASVLPLARQVSFFPVGRVWNMANFGVPLWLYEYRLESRLFKERGRFALGFFNRYFKAYDHLHVVGSGWWVLKDERRKLNLGGQGDSVASAGGVGVAGFDVCTEDGRGV